MDKISFKMRKFCTKIVGLSKNIFDSFKQTTCHLNFSRDPRKNVQLWEVFLLLYKKAE